MPEYHEGMNVVLKNALDLMEFDEFAGKLWGLVGVPGNKRAQPMPSPENPAAIKPQTYCGPAGIESSGLTRSPLRCNSK